VRVSGARGGFAYFFNGPEIRHFHERSYPVAI
jgi:hypothetical protein